LPDEVLHGSQERDGNSVTVTLLVRGRDLAYTFANLLGGEVGRLDSLLFGPCYVITARKEVQDGAENPWPDPVHGDSERERGAG
jgi:hypothetical protein